MSIILQFVFILAIFPIAAGTLAKGKNRSVPLWAVLGLLFGPFAVLVLALIKPGPGPDKGYQ